MKNKGFKSIDFVDDQLVLIDQTKLPLTEEYIKTDSVDRIAEAIRKLEVRGAPAIGVAAAYAIALAFKNSDADKENFERNYNLLASTRPTAVNLFWALDEMKKCFEENYSAENIYQILLSKAKEIHQDDIDMCNRIAENGSSIFGDSPKNVLTHCNTGQLATGGGGTALYVIIKAFEKGLVNHVWVDETRPLLQGSRLTAFELEKSGIPFSIITDSTAAMLMAQGKIDLAITGADRIAANGDSANKIGTYSVAVNCKHHNLPFYIAAPMSTIDSSCKSGKDIVIEERSSDEITKIKNVQVTKSEYNVYSPAFDVTPAELISGIITDVDLFKHPFDF